MAEDTRAGLHDALAAHLAAQEGAGASGQDPAGVDRSGIEAAARAHLDASDDKDDLQARYEDLHAQLADDPGDAELRAEESDAANRSRRWCRPSGSLRAARSRRMWEARPPTLDVGRQ